MVQEENQMIEMATNSRLKNENSSSKWTLYLFLCCLTTCISTVQVGFNVAVINLPTPLIKDFYLLAYFPMEHELKVSLQKDEKKFNDLVKNILMVLPDSHKSLTHFETDKHDLKFSSNISDLAEFNRSLIERSAEVNTLFQMKKIESKITMFWSMTAGAFIVGGMIGALMSKFMSEFFGRKKGIIFNYTFTIMGSVLVIVSTQIASPACVIISRLFFGIQSGIAHSLVPTYLNEISPSDLRGATGTINHACFTMGILISQVLGFRQILGDAKYWPLLLGMPGIFALFGGILLAVFFPESPKISLVYDRDEETAKKSIRRLSKVDNVDEEIEKIKKQMIVEKKIQAVSFKQMLTGSEYRARLVTGIILNCAHHLAGTTMIFFYSESIFREAGIHETEIQYAVVLTGVINLITSLIVVPLIDKLGRKPLLAYSMGTIVINYCLFTIFLCFQKEYKVFSYLSIACIVLAIICFAVGLGPIPFIYVIECFKPEARSSAMAICMFINMTVSFALTLLFPYLAMLLKNYVFMIFTVVIAIMLVFVVKKVPETKGKSPDEIADLFHSTPAENKHNNNNPNHLEEEINIKL